VRKSGTIAVHHQEPVINRMPTVFVSHGAPTFATEPGLAGPALELLGKQLPRPRAIVILSPHWMTRRVTVGASPAPATIHDFGGFPAELYALRYPAPGDPELAARIVKMLAPHEDGVHADPVRGLDHGAWVPLRYLYPQADVPVVQISLPTNFDAAGAFRLGQQLAPLSAEGVLIIGSGSLTHNLSEFRGTSVAADAEYVRRFVAWSRAAVTTADTQALIDYLHSAPDARRAHPTSDHYLPLPFAAGAAPAGTRARVVDGGIAYGILSMDAFVFGAAH
jgi:4,5-DOPA dioxygenase extradiol